MLFHTACSASPSVDCNGYPEADCREAVEIARSVMAADQEPLSIRLDVPIACAPWWMGSCPPSLADEADPVFAASVWADIGADRPVIINVERTGRLYRWSRPIGSESIGDGGEGDGAETQGPP